MSWTEECLECGYLLKGDDSFRGRRVKCPKCKSAVSIPSSDDEGDYGLSPLSPEEQAKRDAEMNPPEAGGEFSDVSIRAKGRRVGKARLRGGVSGPMDDSPRSDAPTAGFDLANASAESLVHLPCPNGHVLEIERSMMGNWAMCPHCGERFKMLLRNTQEDQHEQQRAEQREIARSSKKWMNYAIVAIVLVVLFLVLLIALAVGT